MPKYVRGNLGDKRTCDKAFCSLPKEIGPKAFGITKFDHYLAKIRIKPDRNYKDSGQNEKSCPNINRN